MQAVHVLPPLIAHEETPPGDSCQFISVKGIKAQGNQLTPHKIKQVNTLESLEYRPEDGESKDENDPTLNEVKEDENDSDSAQTTLF